MIKESNIERKIRQELDKLIRATKILEDGEIEIVKNNFVENFKFLLDIAMKVKEKELKEKNEEISDLKDAISLLNKKNGYSK
jgi:hypothetical protein